MRISFLILFMSTTCLKVAGQSSNLVGHVYFINSNKTPAIGVEVSANDANLTYSDNTGLFRLIFAVSKVGQPAHLQVGEKDGNNANIELVNIKEVSTYVIPDSTSDVSCNIIVCKSGELMKSKAYYYNIGQEYLKSQYAIIKKQKEELLSLHNASAEMKKKYADEVEDLENKYSDALSKQDELSTYLATIDKDFASTIVLEALKNIDDDKDIEKAIEALNTEKLEKAFKSAQEEEEKAIKGFEMKTHLLTNALKYNEAIVVYKKLIQILEEAHTSSELMTDKYFNLADMYFTNGDYVNSAESYKKILNFYSSNSSNDEKKVECYFKLINAYVKAGMYDDAQATSQLAYEIISAHGADFNKYMAGYYRISGDAALRSEKFQEAINLYNKALGIFSLDSAEADFALIYENIGIAYSDSNDYLNALKYYKLALAERENTARNLTNLFSLKKDKDGNPMTIALAYSYGNIATLFYNLNDKPQALYYQKRDLEIRQQLQPPTHPMIISGYLTMIIIYDNLKDTENLKLYLQKYIDAKVNKEGSMDFIEDTILEYIALRYKNIGDLTDYKKYFQICINRSHNRMQLLDEYDKQIQLFSTFGDTVNALKYLSLYIQYCTNNSIKDVRLANGYLICGAFLSNKDKPKAVEFLKKAAVIYKKEDPKSESLHTCYTFLSFIDKDKKNENKYDRQLQSFQTEDENDKRKKELGQRYAIDNPFENNPEIQFQEYYKLGNTAFSNKDYAKSLDIFKSAMKLGHDTLLYPYIGLCYYYLNQFDSAINAYNKALKLDSSYYPIYCNNIGMAYVKVGLIEDAKKVFKRFDSYFPNNPKVYRNWALINLVANQYDSAIINLKKAVQLGFDDINWIMDEKLLKKVREDNKYSDIFLYEIEKPVFHNYLERFKKQ